MVSFIGGFSSIRFCYVVKHWNTCIIQQGMSASLRPTANLSKKNPYFLPSVQVYQDMQISAWYVLLVCLINMFFFAVWRSTEALTIHQIMSAAVWRPTSNLSRKKHMIFFYSSVQGLSWPTHQVHVAVRDRRRWWW